MEERLHLVKRCTIEQRLEHYVEQEKGDERYEIMWHAWKHNKRWLCQMMEWIMPSYQHYSRHDETHALAILHNIEMLLGAEQIDRLSASDCFLILHVVYLHDIGMCITHKDRESLMRNKSFMDYLEQNRKYGSDRIRKYADILLTYCQDMKAQDDLEDMLETKLEIYYAILYLVSEYNRKEHASIAKDRLNKWIREPDMLGIGFSTSGIPSRFFFMISACASVHTSWDFNDVLDLPWEDGGYPHDYMHPRFAAVLLQLGDALDLDNDRFHPLIKEFAGNLPKESKNHLEKHQSIRRLRISPTKITIEANCSTPESLRLVSNECESIKEILRHAAVHWSAICPPELTAHLPNFEPAKLMLEGKQLDEKIVNPRFMIQQNKAFNLLQGSNIYADNDFVFLRELIQNAVDASKIQYWADWKGSRWYDEHVKDLTEIGKCISPLSYPVEIEFHIAKKGSYDDGPVILDTKRDKYERREDKDSRYGVLVRVIDYGIGITGENVSNIAEVGSGYKYKDKTVDMPYWLEPTAEFGIGLQSVFLTADTFWAYTHPRTEEKYRIMFTGTGEKGDGHINVTPLEKSDPPQSYGTIFEVFVSSEHRISSSSNPDYYSGRDRFKKSYVKNRELIYARELAVQMALYVDSLIGEKLFPVFIKLYDFENDEDIFAKMLKGKMKNVRYGLFINGKILDIEDSTYLDAGSNPYLNPDNVTWSYHLPGQTNKFLIYQGDSGNGYMSALDCQNAKLYLWNIKQNVYARFGSDRLQALRDIQKNNDQDIHSTYTRIYYKGIYARGITWKDDANMLEYIDIKGKMETRYLALNRGGFTKEGENYIRQNIYPDILRAAQSALRYYDGADKMNCLEENLRTLVHTLKREMDLQKAEELQVQIQKFILSVIGLASFAQLRSASDFPMVSDKYTYESSNTILKNISELVKAAQRDRTSHWVQSTFFKIKVFRLKIERSMDIAYSGPEFYNIADIMDRDNKFAVMSKRNTTTSAWEEVLVRLEAESPEVDIKTLIRELKMQWDQQKREDLIEQLEKIGHGLVRWREDALLNNIDNDDPVMVLNQNLIVKWLLRNLPTIALCSDPSATVRVNILDLEYTDSIYFDVNMRWNIYERMYEVYRREHKERFMSYATTGYCQLAVEQEITDVRFVSRGQFSPTGLKHIIMPFTSEALRDIFAYANDMDIGSENSEIYDIFNIFMWLDAYIDQKSIEGAEEKGEDSEKENEERQKDENWGNIRKDRLNDMLERMLERDPYSQKEILCLDKKEFEKRRDDILECLSDAPRKNEDIENWLKKYALPRYHFIRSKECLGKWMYEKKENIEKILLENCGFIGNNGNETSFERMTAYLQEKNWLHMSPEKYRRLYEHYIQEMATMFWRYHMEKLKVLSKRRSILKKIIQSR